LGCVDQIRARTDFEPDVALFLDSGLGKYAKKLNIVAALSKPFSVISFLAAATIFLPVSGVQVYAPLTSDTGGNDILHNPIDIVVL